jgi:uncharacterized protein with HEPN domain
MKDDSVYVKHILDSIAKIEEYTEGLDFDKFCESNIAQSGVIRELEVIGEASKNLSSEFINSLPDVPWRDIGDMRNKLIHEYFNIDLEAVWKTAIEDLPKVKSVLEK